MKNFYTVIGVYSTGVHVVLSKSHSEVSSVQETINRCKEHLALDTEGRLKGAKAYKRFIAFDSGGFVAQYDADGNVIPHVI